MYRENPLKQLYAKGGRAFGCWLQLSHPAVAEMLALCGYDLVLIDMEHGPGTLPETANMLRAVAGTPAAAVVRVPANDPVFLKRLLDQGPDGVMIPMVETAAEAEAAVAACRYPPRGSRGWAAGVARASSYGLVGDYTQKAHDNLLIICQIESVKGVDNIDAIAAVDGVDMIFVGRNDLAASAGHILELDDPSQDALLARIVEATRRAGKLIGTVPSRGLGWPQLFAQGFDMVLPSSDISMLRDRALAEISQRRDLAIFPNASRSEITVISPYKHHGVWVFDDPRVGLVEEAFVAGADTMIDRVTADIPDAERGFTMLFSASPFPGHQYRLEWRRGDDSGNWYYEPQLDLEGWLCPALFRYFPAAPKQLFVQVKPRT